MSSHTETDAPIPIPPRPVETAVALTPRIDRETSLIADTLTQDQVISEQNNVDLIDQERQETYSDLELPPKPPKDLEFNSLLLWIAEEMEHDDLEKIKFLLSGEEGLSKRTSEKIKSPMDLFKELKKMSLISRHDILYLQLILSLVGKKKPIQMARDFASEARETLHFFPPPEKPADGYKYVKLHVKVPDVRKYKRESLEQLRRRVSIMTFAPESVIRIVGVELQSILVTFMVPSVYADILEDMLERNVNTDAFQEMMVDRVFVGSKGFSIDFKGKDNSADTNNGTTEADNKSATTYKSQESQRLNEESEMGSLKLATELETIKLTMEQKEEDSSKEIDKLKKENTSSILEPENIKQQNYLEHTRYNGVKPGEWSKGGAHYKLTTVLS